MCLDESFCSRVAFALVLQLRNEQEALLQAHAQERGRWLLQAGESASANGKQPRTPSPKIISDRSTVPPTPEASAATASFVGEHEESDDDPASARNRSNRTEAARNWEDPYLDLDPAAVLAASTARMQQLQYSDGRYIAPWLRPSFLRTGLVHCAAAAPATQDHQIPTPGSNCSLPGTQLSNRTANLLEFSCNPPPPPPSPPSSVIPFTGNPPLPNRPTSILKPTATPGNDNSTLLDSRAILPPTFQPPPHMCVTSQMLDRSGSAYEQSQTIRAPVLRQPDYTNTTTSSPPHSKLSTPRVEFQLGRSPRASETESCDAGNNSEQRQSPVSSNPTAPYRRAHLHSFADRNSSYFVPRPAPMDTEPTEPSWNPLPAPDNTVKAPASVNPLRSGVITGAAAAGGYVRFKGQLTLPPPPVSYRALCQRLKEEAGAAPAPASSSPVRNIITSEEAVSSLRQQQQQKDHLQVSRMVIKMRDGEPGEATWPRQHNANQNSNRQGLVRPRSAHTPSDRCSSTLADVQHWQQHLRNKISGGGGGLGGHTPPRRPSTAHARSAGRGAVGGLSQQQQDTQQHLQHHETHPQQQQQDQREQQLQPPEQSRANRKVAPASATPLADSCRLDSASAAQLPVFTGRIRCIIATPQKGFTISTMTRATANDPNSKSKSRDGADGGSNNRQGSPRRSTTAGVVSDGGPVSLPEEAVMSLRQQSAVGISTPQTVFQIHVGSASGSLLLRPGAHEGPVLGLSGPELIVRCRALEEEREVFGARLDMAQAHTHELADEVCSAREQWAAQSETSALLQQEVLALQQALATLLLQQQQQTQQPHRHRHRRSSHSAHSQQPPPPPPQQQHRQQQGPAPPFPDPSSSLPQVLPFPDPSSSLPQVLPFPDPSSSLPQALPVPGCGLAAA
ncbi:MAG: hypothetical protein WDW36_001460 [Sanguina aurantia]